jgi:trigger factor
LKIDTTTLENHQVKLTVEVEPETLESAKRRAARQIAKKTKIPGFRPGKAPYLVIVRQIGEATILEEAIDLLVQDVYPKAIDEAGIHPYGPGKLENVASMEPPKFEFVIPLEAEVELGDFHSIRRPYEPDPVTEKQVDDVIEDLRDRQAILEPVTRPAQEGDVVYVRIDGQRLNPDEGEDANLVSERSLPILIAPVKAPADEHEEDDTPEEWPFPGFSRNLISLSVGDEKTVNHQFSEDSSYEALQGKEATFHYLVEDIKSRTLPELNDDFAMTVGDFENVDALRVEVRKELEQRAEDEYNQDYDETILEEAVNQSTIKYPPEMLEREIDYVIDNLESRLSQQKVDLDLYLKSRQMEMDGLREESRPVAEKRLRQMLVLSKIASEEGIEVEPDELQNETMRTVDSLYRVMPKKEARKLNQQKVLNNLVGNIMADMLTQKAMSHLRDSSRGLLEARAEESAEEAVAEPGAEPSAEEKPDEAAAETAIEPQAEASEPIEAEPAIDQSEPVAEVSGDSEEKE